MSESGTVPVTAHSRALRKGRCSIEGQVYLLTTVTLGRRPVFEDFWLACLCCRTLTQRALWQDACLLAWVLMPDHLHLLVQLGADGSLPRLMQRVKCVTALEVGRATGRCGLWQHGFHDHALRMEEGVADAARYVIANPVRAGLVRNVREYSFWGAVWVDGVGSEPLDP